MWSLSPSVGTTGRNGRAGRARQPFPMADAVSRTAGTDTFGTSSPEGESVGTRRSIKALAAVAAVTGALTVLPAFAQAVYPTSTNGRISFVRCDANQCDI